MKINLDPPGGHYAITAYRPGMVTVNGAVYTRSLIVTPEQLIPDWPPRRLDEMTAAHVAAVAALSPQVVLLGTGPRLCFPPSALLAPLLAAGIGVECMDSAAACRSFAVLGAEGRRVAAALII